MKILSGNQHYLYSNALYMLISILIGATVLSFPAFAESTQKDPLAPENKKLHITSDKLVSNQNELYIKFIGHVKAVHGETTINSDQLKVFYSKGNNEKQEPGKENIKKIVATGNVVITLNNGLAECDRAVYLTKTKTITLTGKTVRLLSEKNNITGKKITIYQETGQIVIEGNSDTRVNAFFEPENDAQYFDLK